MTLRKTSVGTCVEVEVASITENYAKQYYRTLRTAYSPNYKYVLRIFLSRLEVVEAKVDGNQSN